MPTYRPLRIAFEAVDGAGKSTQAELLRQAIYRDKPGWAQAANLFRRPGSALAHYYRCDAQHVARNPFGCTANGAVCAPITISAIGDTLRGIIKNVGVDVRTEQLLMAAEHNAFVQGMLEFEAKLDCDRPIWASIFDRWNPISALAYGYKGFHEGDGHSGCLEAQQRLQALYKLTTPYYLDCLFILQAPWEVIQPRIASRGTACKVEARGEDFLRSVCSAYDSILTYAAWRDGVLQHTRNLIGLDATQAPQDIHREVMSRICSLYNP